MKSLPSRCRINQWTVEHGWNTLVKLWHNLCPRIKGSYIYLTGHMWPVLSKRVLSRWGRYEVQEKKRGTITVLSPGPATNSITLFLFLSFLYFNHLSWQPGPAHVECPVRGDQIDRQGQGNDDHQPTDPHKYTQSLVDNQDIYWQLTSNKPSTCLVKTSMDS